MDVQEDGGNYTRFNEDVQLHFCLKANRGCFFFFCFFAGFGRVHTQRRLAAIPEYKRCPNFCLKRILHLSLSWPEWICWTVSYVWENDPSSPHSHVNPCKRTRQPTRLIPSLKKSYCWYQRLKECSVSSLQKYHRIIYTVQWLIIHLYIHHTSVVKHLKQYKLTFVFSNWHCTLERVKRHWCRLLGPLWTAPVSSLRPTRWNFHSGSFLGGGWGGGGKDAALHLKSARELKCKEKWTESQVFCRAAQRDSDCHSFKGVVVVVVGGYKWFQLLVHLHHFSPADTSAETQSDMSQPKLTRLKKKKNLS